MTTQLLFYQDVVPLNAERHKDWHLKALKDYSFTDSVNSVPLMAVEFMNGSFDYPIVFAGDAEAVMPVLLLGLRRSENVFVAADGHWDGKYIPAFIRRYPFVFSRSEDGEKFYLCIDETCPGFNQDDEGEVLFADENKPSDYTNSVLKFLTQYQSEFLKTQEICKKLKDLNLLEAKQAEATLPSGKKTTLSGFYAVDRSRLSTLPSEAIVDLVRSGAYELICYHLASLRNFNELRDRTSEQEGDSSEQEGDSGA